MSTSTSQSSSASNRSASAVVKTKKLDTQSPALSNLNTVGTRPLGLVAEPIATGGIRIKWNPLGLDSTGEIVVFRKLLEADQWDPLAIGVPSFDATQFEDPTAVTGVRYEYKVVIYTTLGAAPYEKYVLAANQGAAIADRGTILLVIDETQLDTTRDAAGTTLAPALQKYKMDLIADGYRVMQIVAPRVDVPRTFPAGGEDSTPEQITAHSASWIGPVMALKQQIRSIWQSTPDLKTVLLLGHVPLPYSGMISPDSTIGHEQSLGAWPADIFYSTLSTPDSLWLDEQTIGTIDAHINLPGDGKFDQDYLTQLGLGTEYENAVFSDVAVGRVDFAMLANFLGVNLTAGAKATPAETELLARYLEKVHEYKTGQWNVKRQALFEEAFPFGEYYDTNRLTPNVGLDQVKFGTVSPFEPSLVNYDAPYPSNVPPPTTYDLNNDSWLWMYTGAGGFPLRSTLQYNPNRQLRSDQYVNGAYSSASDFTKNNQFGTHKSVFNFIYGSYVGDWDYRDSLLRTVIAEPQGYGLVSMWGARPVWQQHHMGLGEPLSVSAVKSWNNFGAKNAYGYDPNSGSTRQSVLGDPTLRQDSLAPATDVRVDLWNASGNRVAWNASSDAGVIGYYVFRASAIDGSYSLLNSTPVSGTSFVDASLTSPNGAYYMVRAAKLETTPSGSYVNLALGAYSAPQVVAATFNSADRPHSVTLTFSHDVGSSLSASDLIIAGNRKNFSTGAMVPITFVAGIDYHIGSYDAATRTAVVVFDTQNEQAVSQMLPSGRYTVSFVGGSVTNGAGESVDAAYSFELAFLSGDTNGDFIVNFDDLLTLAQRYGSSVSSNPFASGDFNDDGVVNFDDLLLLAQHYGTSV